MIGWEKLWRSPEVRKRWEQMPPLPEVREMADLLAASGRRRVLDIGCGLGRHAVYLAARGFEVTAVDNAPAAISACQQNLSEAGLSAAVVHMEMTDLHSLEGEFDGAAAVMVIHHARRATLARIIDHITQKLAPAGLFVWETATPKHFHCGRGKEIEPGTWVNPDHPEGPIPHHYATEEEVRELLGEYDILSLHEHEFREGPNSRFHWRVLARKRSDP